MMREFRKVSFLAIVALTASASGCHPPASAPVGSSVPAAPVTQSAPPQRAQQGSAILPDPHLTPGATLDVTTDDICVPGYTKLVRDVPGAVKRQVYTEYGITDHAPGEYEV